MPITAIVITTIVELLILFYHHYYLKLLLDKILTTKKANNFQSVLETSYCCGRYLFVSKIFTCRLFSQWLWLHTCITTRLLLLFHWLLVQVQWQLLFLVFRSDSSTWPDLEPERKRLGRFRWNLTSRNVLESTRALQIFAPDFCIAQQRPKEPSK